MGFLARAIRKQFEDKKPPELTVKADIRMISGCEDRQTSADVSNVSQFQLPDAAGRAGGACTSTLLQVLYKDHHDVSKSLSYSQALNQMREILAKKGFSQIPQLSASHDMDINTTFDFVPNEASGTRRALLIGINYVGHEKGQLSGCHNDVKNMIEYIKDCHGFNEQNITILMDDGEHTSPTKANILQAYKDIVEAAQPGDSLFCHYSGHGATIRDDEISEEADNVDEALVPLDFHEAGMIRDDDLFNTLIKPLKDDVHLVCLMDCCHSGTVLDLPYHFKADGHFTQMEIDEGFDFDKMFKKLGHVAGKIRDILD